MHGSETRMTLRAESITRNGITEVEKKNEVFKKNPGTTNENNKIYVPVETKSENYTKSVQTSRPL